MQLVELHTETDLRFSVNPEFVANVWEAKNTYHGCSITMHSVHEDIHVKEDYDTVIALFGTVIRQVGGTTIMRIGK